MKLNLLTFVGPALIGKGSRIAHHSGATNIVRWASPIPSDYSAPGEESPPFTSNLQASSLMYGFAEFRGIVSKYDKYFNEGSISKRQEKKLKKENGIGLVPFREPELIDTRNSAANPFPAAKMKNPVTAAAVLRFLELNQEYVGQNENGKPTFANIETDVPLARQNLQELFAEFDADLLEYDDQFTSPDFWSSHGFTDTLVYSIAVNRKNKRITVAFRGSVSNKDWAVDLRFFKSNTPDIIDEFTESKPKIHKGFAGFLLNKPIKEEEAKIDQIIDVLKEVYSYKTYKEDGTIDRDYSEYDLYVTGHSLGGALTQLCAFTLAGSEKSSFIPKPINAISFASPVVGNGDFVEEHQKLEKDGKLRHIRVSNQGDAVPVKLFGFEQTGVNFHVKEGEEMEVAYLNGKSLRSQFNLDAGARHSLQGEGSYYSRLYVKDESGSYLNKEVLDKPIEKLYEDYADHYEDYFLGRYVKDENGNYLNKEVLDKPI